MTKKNLATPVETRGGVQGHFFSSFKFGLKKTHNAEMGKKCVETKAV
jgi:hypothetical protein